MKRIIRIAGLSLIAAVAVGALASTSASAALPEWGKCVKVPYELNGKVHKKGKYADANCTEKLGTSTGEYEFLKGTSAVGNTQFTAVQTSEKAVLQTAQGVSVECTSTVATGNLFGAKEVSGVAVTFKGCRLPLLSFTCEGFFENEFPNKYIYKEGEIITRSLKGHLGYISGQGTASPTVGLSLTPEEKGGLFAEFVCGTENSGVGVLIVRVGAKEKKSENGGDSIISPITPVNQMGTALTQTYSEKQIEVEPGVFENEHGIQEPEKFETGKRDVLESEASTAFGTLGWSQSGQIETLQTSLNSGEELEVKG
jgi:hypothetical protein